MRNKEKLEWERVKITPFKGLSDRLAAIKEMVEAEREKVREEIAQKKEKNG